MNYPSWLKPEIIPGLPFRWYSLMYIVAFGIAYYLYRRQIKERRFPMSEDNLYSLFCWGIIGLILGARLFHALVYSPLERFVNPVTGEIIVRRYYLTKPWLIFWPFDEGRFTGLQGMSYHGGAIGGFLAVIIWARVKNIILEK